MPTLISFLVYVFAIIPTYGYNVTASPQAVSYYVIGNEVHGSTILLAHEDLAGSAFYDLQGNDHITLEYPDKEITYQVTKMRWFWATDPLSSLSYFHENLSTKTFDSLGLGTEIYASGSPLILQTCFTDSRGRLFIFADVVGGK